ncbi:12250_t:CDS:1 [Funneliformis geosporum]|uniref:15295_t:CDS:1 n=1 Tax=Funneliformis geosporum TaxID=1117311 RepID=A0A9W4STD3_9GLOM|nr:12250_t:CDS:1 [Funneliformis geosporum]CAI2180804.1 15295_t:CDS:1 [Funneliformis geosporum]
MNPFDKIKMDYNQFLQSASYLEGISQIIDESYRPNFPPDIIIEEFVTRFDRKKRISENRGNAFIVYRKYFCRYLERSGIKLDQKLISPLAGYLWRTESKERKECYKAYSEQINNIYRKQLLGDDKINKRQHPDDDDNQPQNHKRRISTIEGQNPIDDVLSSSK